MISEMILTAGPSITEKEVFYAMDAAANGWNRRMNGFIDLMEMRFREYLGVKHAMVTSSCTGALHLSLAAMGIGPGDEVIVPETTWVATANVVTYVGATPVFVDIEPDTWVMDVDKVEAAVTPNTKAIIPVHLYGHPVDMDALNEIASRHGLYILEDAAPSLGSEYKKRKTGSLGTMAAFSFQGAKIAAIGEGGILVTDDDDLFERALYYNRTAVDPHRPLYCTDIGYKYRMANVQAGLGAAQIERMDELVAQKRRIFHWYQERLGDLDVLTMNAERDWARNNYWMTTIVLDPSLDIERDEFMQKLREKNIDCRPVFHPMSSLPMYNRAVNPVAYDVPLRAINLPSGHQRTEEEIDYISYWIRNLTRQSKGITSDKPTGWLAFRELVYSKLKESKNQQQDHMLKFGEGSPQSGSLNVVSDDVLSNEQDIARLAKWRDNVKEGWPSQFEVTLEGTRNWVEKQVINAPDRLLFWVVDNNGNKLGHMGLFRFDFHKKSCEIDNVIRGEAGSQGIMTVACEHLINWCFDSLHISTLYLSLKHDNARALSLYETLGFQEIQRTPLRKIKTDSGSEWIPVLSDPYHEVERYAVYMKLSAEDRRTQRA